MFFFNIIKRVARWSSHLAGVGLVVLMTVTVLDVLGRNLGLFNIEGVMDISILCLLVVGGFSLAAGFIDERHLVVELGTQHLSPKLKSRLEACWLILGVVPLVLTAVLAYEEGVTLAGYGQVTGVLEWSPMFLHTLAAVALAITALASLAVGIRKAAGRATSMSDGSDEPLE